MDSTVPADLLKLKTRLEAWRTTRRYARQPIPDEFRQAAAEMAGRYSPSLVCSVLKLDRIPSARRLDNVSGVSSWRAEGTRFSANPGEQQEFSRQLDL